MRDAILHALASMLGPGTGTHFFVNDKTQEEATLRHIEHQPDHTLILHLTHPGDPDPTYSRYRLSILPLPQVEWDLPPPRPQ